MKILLTNDDGIEAPGLAALLEAMSEHGSVVVVAPSQPMSGASHQVTVDGPLVVHSLGADRYAVDGSPADRTRSKNPPAKVRERGPVYFVPAYLFCVSVAGPMP